MMRRYPSTLFARQANQDATPLDKAACFQGIVAGARHLHALGVAHNDINPYNVMLDGDNHPVIIDLGSCKHLGLELTEVGTPGWNEGFEDVSSTKNDEIGLGKIHKWLGISGTYPGANRDESQPSRRGDDGA